MTIDRHSSLSLYLYCPPSLVIMSKSIHFFCFLRWAWNIFNSIYDSCIHKKKEAIVLYFIGRWVHQAVWVQVQVLLVFFILLLSIKYIILVISTPPYPYPTFLDRCCILYLYQYPYPVPVPVLPFELMNRGVIGHNHSFINKISECSLLWI